MDILLYATPLGLLLDIAGVALLIIYGHSLFLRLVPKLPDNPKDDTIYLIGDSDAGKVQKDKRRRFLAYFGIGTLLFGFTLQLVGSIAAICF